MDLLASMQQRDCPVCGASATSAAPFMASTLDPARLNAESFASRKLPEFMSYRLVTCTTCKVVFASEAPAAGALAHAYHQADYSTADEANFAARVYARAIEPFVADLPRRGIALEIGTGSGVFLGHLRQLGFADPVGIEPSPAAIATAADDIRPMIREGIFTGDEFAENSVSLACCFMTLEHIPDPRGFVEAAFRMLEPGGMIAMITHDYTAPVNRLLGRRSPIIDIEHLQLFCPPALRHLVRAAGFDAPVIQSFRNVYPLRYWLRLLPLPGGLKQAILSAAETAGVGSASIGANVGNLLTVARKPVAG
jgi:SAM-dependent methyltransferase